MKLVLAAVAAALALAVTGCTVVAGPPPEMVTLDTNWHASTSANRQMVCGMFRTTPNVVWGTYQDSNPSVILTRSQFDSFFNEHC
jgi:hypothetical protein